MELLEGYRRPDLGTLTVLGLDPIAEARQLRPRVGVMLQEGGIYPTLQVIESVRLFAGYYRNPEDPGALLQRVGLQERARTRFRQLSGGEKQRLSLALALVGRPEVLFLDEPTAAMDPRGRLGTWELVRDLRRRGTTILLTTHSMEEAERLADRVAILNQGSLVACDTPKGLSQRSGSDLVQLELQADLRPSQLAEVRAMPGVERVDDRGGGAYWLRCREPGEVAARLTELVRVEGPALRLLRVGRSSLEEVFLELTEEAPQ